MNTQPPLQYSPVFPRIINPGHLFTCPIGTTALDKSTCISPCTAKEYSTHTIRGTDDPHVHAFLHRVEQWNNGKPAGAPLFEGFSFLLEVVDYQAQYPPTQPPRYVAGNQYQHDKTVHTPNRNPNNGYDHDDGNIENQGSPHQHTNINLNSEDTSGDNDTTHTTTHNTTPINPNTTITIPLTAPNTITGPPTASYYIEVATDSSPITGFCPIPYRAGRVRCRELDVKASFVVWCGVDHKSWATGGGGGGGGDSFWEVNVLG